jgi:hypothetical protein
LNRGDGGNGCGDAGEEAKELLPVFEPDVAIEPGAAGYGVRQK